MSLIRQGCRAEVSRKASRPVGASLPPLGLSNKATESTHTLGDIHTSTNDSTEIESSDEDTSSGETPSHPPFDSELATVTLWPENEKLFGHGYEVRPYLCIAYQLA